MSFNFYQSKEYKEKQSAITRNNWRKGIFDFHRKTEKRVCERKECNKVFEVIPSNPKIFCSQNCAAKVSNKKRGGLSQITKLKISKSLKSREGKGIRNPFKGIIKVPRVEVVCANPNCGKVFLKERWMYTKKFCSRKCQMAVIGGRPTSPKAARGKAGIRKDIDKNVYFYSRWEANIARLFNLLNIKWIHQAKTFDLVSQKYTPDFYLPEKNIYIEVKNFLWKYSAIRDEKFRKLYPEENLILLLKEDYLKIEKKYSGLIGNWEYKNSPFPNNN